MLFEVNSLNGIENIWKNDVTLLDVRVGMVIEKFKYLEFDLFLRSWQTFKLNGGRVGFDRRKYVTKSKILC